MNIASIDIGSNTVLLLVAEVDIASKKIKTIKNEYRIPRIGQGLIPDQPIKTEKINLLKNILIEFENTINKYNCKYTIVTATNALRIASNSNFIIEDIKKEFKLETNIVSGKDESKLSYLGAISENYYNRKSLVIDIGGGSTEISLGQNGKIDFNESYPLGVVSCTEKYLKNFPLHENEIDLFAKSVNEYLFSIPKFCAEISISIAGTPTTLACMKKGLKSFDENLIEGEILTINEIKKFADSLVNLSPSKILSTYGKIVEGREDILLAGTLILKLILSYFELPQTIVSSKGIRYGAIIDFLQKNF